MGRLRDCTLTPDAATVAVVERALAETDADVVYVHARDDSHQDHRATAAATLSAARRLSRVWHQESPSTLTFSPTTFVDVTAYLSGKLAALGARALAGGDVGDGGTGRLTVVASARHWGARAGIGYAEAFAPTRMVLDLAPVPRHAVEAVPEAHRLIPTFR